MLLKLFRSYITTHGMTSHNKQNRPLLENAMTVTLKKKQSYKSGQITGKIQVYGSLSIYLSLTEMPEGINKAIFESGFLFSNLFCA